MSLRSSVTSTKRQLRPIVSRHQGKIVFDGKEYWDFSSNDYLGFSEEKLLKDTAHFGSTGSRLLSGDSILFHQLEDELARFLNKESALVFNSGYQANVGIISALAGKGDAIFADRLVHASLIDGIRLSGAKLYRFHHNDMVHLRSLLQKNRTHHSQSLIITESVFSMDGDLAPLDDLAALKTEFHSTLYVDAAHGIGIFAPPTQADILVGTFGKAFGSFGAFVGCSAAIKDQLIQTCRSFIYSTALPLPVVAWNLAALELIQKTDRAKALLEKAALFTAKSQIVPILLANPNPVSEKLRELGYWALPINPPTVPQGQSRLRISLTWHHPESVLFDLINALIGEANKENTIYFSKINV